MTDTSLIECVQGVCLCYPCFQFDSETGKCSISQCFTYQSATDECIDKRKSQREAFLFSFFLSSFGVANFYIGEIVLGIIQLAITLCFICVCCSCCSYMCCIVFSEEDSCCNCSGEVSNSLCMIACTKLHYNKQYKRSITIAIENGWM